MNVANILQNKLQKFVDRRSRLLFSSLRAHISEIIGAVAAHISSQASSVFGTSAKKYKNVDQSAAPVLELDAVLDGQRWASEHFDLPAFD